jgi:hypothetical protein
VSRLSTFFPLIFPSPSCRPLPPSLPSLLSLHLAHTFAQYEGSSPYPKLTAFPPLSSRSFARIHRTNLTKQGVLPLTLANEADYSLVSAGDSVRTSGLTELLRGDLNAEVDLIVTYKDGSEKVVKTTHGLSADAVESIRFGSALNGIKIRAQQ